MQHKANELVKIVSTEVEKVGRKLYALQPEGMPKLGPYVFVFLATAVMVLLCQHLGKPSKVVAFSVFLFFLWRSWAYLRFIESKAELKVLAPSQLPDLEFPLVLKQAFVVISFIGSFAVFVSDQADWGRLLVVPFFICAALFVASDRDTKFF